MEIPERVRPFWERFQASIAYDARPLFYEAFHFDDNEATANALAALVLSRQKRATAGLLWTNECTGKPLPTVGALSVVTDWSGAPRCVIRTTQVDIVPFDAVSERLRRARRRERPNPALVEGRALAFLLARMPAARPRPGAGHAGRVRAVRGGVLAAPTISSPS
jgi:uncharacterized protein YhfF